MSFNSFPFIFFFLPLTLFIATYLRGQWLLGWLTLASYWFYGALGYSWVVIPLFVVTLLDFCIAPCIQDAPSLKRKRAFLFISLGVNLGILLYFKYAFSILLLGQSFFSRSGRALPDSWVTWLNVMMPAGMSFYIFQSIAYTVDIYRGKAKAENNFWTYAAFLSFFPHLLAGPITRQNQLVPDLEKIAANGIHPRWKEGIFLFAVGLCKKILVADRLGDGILHLIRLIPGNGFFACWFLAMGYGVQIYFDFSGYSDMAIGLGRLFDVELPQNFDSPYKAVSPADFWRRWHITLSFWLRDYLFYPLYFAMSRDANNNLKLIVSLMVTMFLGGLWHGASFMLGIWGCYHGLLLILYAVFKKSWDRWNTIVQRIVTFLAISASWIFFRAESMRQAIDWLKGCLGMRGFDFSFFSTANVKYLSILILGVIMVNAFPNASGYKGFVKFPASLQVGLGILVIVAFLYMNNSFQFVYFQF